MKSDQVSGRWALAAVLAGTLTPAWANPYECMIEAQQIVDLRSASEGIIEKILVKRGERVQAGQVLVRLESSAENSAVEGARLRAEAGGRIASAANRLEYAQKKLTRLKELQAQNFVTSQASDEADTERRIAESELRDAHENREVAKYEYRQAQDLLSRRILRSPFNGVVVDRMLNPGDLAEAGAGRKPILRLAQVEPLRVETVLPLEAFGKLQSKSMAQVTPEGLGGAYQAKVVIIDSVFDAASGTFGVRLDLPNTKGGIPAGIRCKVDFPALQGIKGKALGKSLTGKGAAVP